MCGCMWFVRLGICTKTYTIDSCYRACSSTMDVNHNVSAADINAFFGTNNQAACSEVGGRGGVTVNFD